MYRKRLQKQQLLLLQQLLVMLVLGWQLHGVAGIDPADPATSTADSQQQLQHLGTHNGQPPASCLTAAAIVAGCCKDAPPGRPSASRANSILLSYFIGATNDIYGGYRSALRSSTALAGAAYGTYMFDLMEETEVIVVDWGSPPTAPLRCTPEYAKVLDSLPLICSGHGDGRTCQRDLVRIVEVPRDMAQRYALSASVSETHTFNIAVRRARGRMILRIDQDTLTRGPWFSWLRWQKRHRWPDMDIVWWHVRDSGISKKVVPTVVNDLRYYIHHVDHACSQHQNPLPTRPKYNASAAVGDGAEWGTTCINGAVGVYAYPKVLMEDVRGMNERMIYWGGMEAELCLRARKSPKFVNWIDLKSETCGASFSHMEHLYGERKHQGAFEYPFTNDINWGLNNETAILEWVF